MARLKKCAICGEFILETELSVPYKSNRSVHERCFQVSLKAIKKDKDSKLEEKAKASKKKTSPKPRAELKEAMTEEEYVEKKAYYSYLRSIIGDDLPVKVYALTDNYIKQYNFTYESMRQVLVYLNEIIEKELTGDVVGLVPYYHSEAQTYFDSVKRVEEVNKGADMSQMYQEKVIKIQPKKKKAKQIDITTI